MSKANFFRGKINQNSAQDCFSPPNVSVRKLSLLKVVMKNVYKQNSSNEKCVQTTCFFVIVPSNAGSDKKSDQIQKLRAGSKYLSLSITN